MDERALRIFDDRVRAVIDGTATEEDRRALMASMRGDPNLQARYCSQMRMHALLACRGGQVRLATVPRSALPMRAARWKSFFVHVWKPLLAAAGLALAAGAWFWGHAPYIKTQRNAEEKGVSASVTVYPKLSVKQAVSEGEHPSGSSLEGSLVLIDGPLMDPSSETFQTNQPASSLRPEKNQAILPRAATIAASPNQMRRKNKAKRKERALASEKAVASAFVSRTLVGTSLASPVGVTLPYHNEFTESVAELTVAPADQWVFAPATGFYTNDLSYPVVSGSAYFCAPALGGTNIAHARPFTVTSVSSWVNQTGSRRSGSGVALNALAADGASIGYELIVYEKDVSVGNDTKAYIHFYRMGTRVGYHVSGVGGLNNLCLKISGVYTDTDADGVKDALDVTAIVSNMVSGAEATLTYQDAVPLTGNYFALIGSRGGSDVGYVAVSWNSVSLTDDTLPPKGTVVFLF